MKFSDKKMKELNERITVAKSLEEIENIHKELGEDFSTEDMAQFLSKDINEMEKLSDDVLETVSGGIEISDIPQYEVIKEYYKEKGPNLAFILCIYYIPSPICYDIIQIIEEECRDEL